MHLQDHGVIPEFGQFNGIQVHPFELAAVFARLPPAGAIHKDTSHQLRRYSVKLLAILPTRVRLLGESQPGLVYKRGGLERLTGQLVRHFHSSKAAKFVIHERQRFLRSLRVAEPRAFEDAALDFGSHSVEMLAILPARA